MLSIVIAISLTGGLCLQSSTATLTSQVPHLRQAAKDHLVEQPQNEAQRIWEQAIAAKGGREKLYAVRNMVISTNKNTTGLFTKNQVRREELLVFPNKYWFWDDYRPDVFGLRVSMYDYDSNMSYVVSDGEPNQELQPMKDKRRNKALRNAQLSLLLETRWLRPTIIKASIGKVGMRSVDIVETVAEGERVDFAFDRKTYLPVRVSFYDVVKGKVYINTQSFSDYIDLAGIKLPQTHEYQDGSKYRASFHINVEYNENIFLKPPPLEAGPEAWQHKKH